MHSRRYVYNQALEKIKSGEEINFFKLRNKFVTAKNNNIEDWLLETPKDIRAGAIRDLVKSYKVGFSQLKSRLITKFQMNYCKRKNMPSIEIPKTAITLESGALYMYKRFINDKIRLGKREKLKISIDYDCRLQIKNNKWYLVVPIKTKIKKIKNRSEFCSLDPGVRSFQTVYSEESVLQIKVKKELLTKLQERIDKLKSLRDTKIITRYKCKRKERKLYDRINNLIDDLHYKTCDYLTRTYDYIIIPSFESQEVSKRIKSRRVNRELLQLKHYLFRKRLESKCEIRKCIIDVCTEEYTSKTCGRCGTLNEVGIRDIYRCSSCDLVVDRDVNGARNIAIKRFKERNM